MSWQSLATLAGLAIPALGLVNAWLLNQVRMEISALTIQMLQSRASDREELHEWIETDFMRKAEILAKFDILTDRVCRVEDRREDRRDRHAA